IRQSEEARDDEVDSKGTDEEEVKPLIKRRFIGVSIGREAYQRTKEEEVRFDHSKKMKGLETLSVAAQFKLDMKKAQKASKVNFIILQHPKGSSEESGVTPEVPDEPSDASSSSSSDLKIAFKDISSDDDEVTEKHDEVTMNTNDVGTK
ncbi:hypothetical protein Tco_0354569, partial [Tanacetum coccineum]